MPPRPAQRSSRRPLPTIAGLSRLVAAELVQTLDSVDEGAADRLRRMIDRASRIFIAAKGKSALQINGFAMRLTHMGYAVHVVGEATTPAVARRDLLLIGSGSGRTASLVAYGAAARRLGVPLALVTAAPRSSLARHARLVIHLPAATPKNTAAGGHVSVLPMGSLFELSLGLFLELTIVQLMVERRITAKRMFRLHANLE